MLKELSERIGKVAEDLRYTAPEEASKLEKLSEEMSLDAAAEIEAADLIAAEEAYIAEAFDECDTANREIAAAMAMIEAARKRKDKWIQKAVTEETEGDFTKWCKEKGFDGVCQACINKAVDVGGRPQKMALFAVNVSKGKYTYPKKEKDASDNTDYSMDVEAEEENRVIEAAERIINAARKRKRKWIKGINLKKGRLTRYRKPGESMEQAARRALRSDDKSVRSMGSFFIATKSFKKRKKKDS